MKPQRKEKIKHAGEACHSLSLQTVTISIFTMPYSKIIKISTSIAKYTKIVDDYLHDNGLPTPTFNANYAPDVPLSPNVMKVEQDVLEAMGELEAILRSSLCLKSSNQLVVRIFFIFFLFLVSIKLGA